MEPWAISIVLSFDSETIQQHHTQTSTINLYLFAEHAGLTFMLNFSIDPCTLISLLSL